MSRLDSMLGPASAVLAILTGLAACVPERGAAGDARTQVLVVATVHDQHGRNPNYTYEDVARILDTFDPDVVCVEIRPEDFRRQPYLQEMMLATVWGLAGEKEVCAFDWYAGTARRERAELAAQPRYVALQQRLDSLRASNPIASRFDRRHGDYWSGDKDYRFYNGAEYNRYIEEGYRLSLATFGDGPHNLYYETRNRHMMDLAWEVIEAHPGARVALLTGSEHKHYFDHDLRARDGVVVVELEDLLPLADSPPEGAVAAFLHDGDDLPYYMEGYPEDLNRYYRGKLVGLIHGPDMDWRPDIIPERNVEVAGRVLARWRASQPASHRMDFDEAWYRFLADDCEAALPGFAALAHAVESGAVSDPFLRVYTYRNMGLCHDVLGQREDALRAYARSRDLMRGTRMEGREGTVLRDFETVPYQRGRAETPWP